MTAAGSSWKALGAEALADATAHWQAGGEPRCEYEAALFAQWDAERSPS